MKHFSKATSESTVKIVILFSPTAESYWAIKHIVVSTSSCGEHNARTSDVTQTASFYCYSVSILFNGDINLFFRNIYYIYYIYYTSWLQSWKINLTMSILFWSIEANFLNCFGTSWFPSMAVNRNDPSLAHLSFSNDYIESSKCWWMMKKILRALLFQLLDQTHTIIYLYTT